MQDTLSGFHVYSVNYLRLSVKCFGRGPGAPSPGYAPAMGAVLERVVSVRRRAPGDDAFIERLSAAAFGDFDPGAGPRTLGLARRPEAHTLVAERGPDRLGFVVVERTEGTAWVEAIAVVPSERGQGVGVVLMKEALRLARRLGASRVRLTTAQANLEALSLFLKCGFAIEGRMAHYYARGQDACALVRSV